MGEATKYFDVISYDHLGIVQFSVMSHLILVFPDQDR